MCLALPGKVISIEGEGMERSAVVEVGGQTRQVSLAMLPEAEVGQWVLFQTGYALQVLPEDEVERLLELIGEVEKFM
ncbi:MAG TPA: HypC/HybG/HupF family hydrogenase formation chaperone [Acidimicrobiia bacterium]|nr:HypC/HybG/HupF family hydrogenase formation chaperone [Acidimicrobiia bacterium]